MADLWQIQLGATQTGDPSIRDARMYVQQSVEFESCSALRLPNPEPASDRAGISSGQHAILTPDQDDEAGLQQQQLLQGE